MNSLPKPVLTLIISFSFRNRAVCKRWRDAVVYSFAERDFKKIMVRGTASILRMFLAQYPVVDWQRGFERACAAGNENIVHYMAQYFIQRWDTPLAIACKKGHENIVRILIQHGADDWDAGLLGACKGGQKKIACEMIQRGANNLNICLLYAWGKAGIRELLIQNGANISTAIFNPN